MEKVKEKLSKWVLSKNYNNNRGHKSKLDNVSKIRYVVYSQQTTIGW